MRSLRIATLFYLISATAVLMIAIYAYMAQHSLVQNTRHAMKMESQGEAYRVTQQMVELYDHAAAEFKKREPEMRQALETAQNYFLEHGKEAPLEPLKQMLMSRYPGAVYDIYLIEREFVISRSTFAPDIGLDFRHLPMALEILKRVLADPAMIDISPVFHDAVAVDLKRYIVQKALKGDYLVQLGMTMQREYSLHASILKLQKATPSLLRSAVFQYLVNGQTLTMNVEKQWSQEYTGLSKQERFIGRRDLELLNDLLAPMMKGTEYSKHDDAVRTFIGEKIPLIEAFFWEDDRHVHRIAMPFQSYLNMFDESLNILIMEFDRTKEFNHLRFVNLMSLLMFIGLMTMLGLLIWVMRRRIISPLGELTLKMREKEEVRQIAHMDEVGMISATYNRLLRDIRREIQSNETLLEHFKEFTGNAIHQIRTPLSVMKIALEMIETENVKEKQEINAAIQTMEHIYDTLAFSLQREVIEYEPERLDLSELLQKRVELFGPVATAHDNHLVCTVDAGLFFLMNRTEAEFLIDNNLSNAIKFSHPGTDIIIDLKQAGDEILLSFVNSGKGIRDTKAIFRRYEREDDTRQGSGIGLHMVEAVAHKYDILIQVDSENGRNRFRYFFPKM